METENCIHDLKKFTSENGWVCRKCDKSLAKEEVPSREGFPNLSVTCFTTRPGAKQAIMFDKKDAQFLKDEKAYRSMRKNGLQPVRVDGSAEMEAKATTRFEIESGNLMVGKESKIAEALDIVNQSGVSDVFTPVTTATQSEVA